MFTGIIEEIGFIKKIQEKNRALEFEIEAQKILKRKPDLGDSIAVNGVCLTITKLNMQSFHCLAVEETLQKTNLKKCTIGGTVNLESALSLKKKINGHLVQGHIDFTSRLLKTYTEGDQKKLRLTLPAKYAKYLALKGSIALNGVSLTLSNLQKKHFEVTIIPHTAKHTNLGEIKSGTEVNIEVDLIARYLEGLLPNK